MKPEQTVQQKARRVRAFELYLAPNPDGSKRSLRSIAGAIGVTDASVRYWARTDKWDERVASILDGTKSAVETSARQIRVLLRDGLQRHLRRLDGIIRGNSDRNAIAGIKEWVDIAKKLDALGSDLFNPEAHAPTFKDDISHDQARTGTAGAGPGEPGPIAPDPTRVQLTSFDAAVAGLAEDLADSSMDVRDGLPADSDGVLDRLDLADVDVGARDLTWPGTISSTSSIPASATPAPADSAISSGTPPPSPATP